MSNVRQPVINGQALKRARLRKGWTHRDLAQACKDLGTLIDYGNINKAEHGRGGIGVRKLPGLARALGVTVDEITADDEPEDAAATGVAA